MASNPDVSPLGWSHLGVVEYAAARSLQRELAAARVEGRARDALLTLEHPPVFTIGRRTSGVREDELRAASGAPVLRTERGGDVTFHGPGQLVAYPVVRLTAQGRGVRAFVAALEAALIDTAHAFGAPALRRPGAAGVWAEDGTKLGSIGIAVRRGVTLHGASLNLDRRAALGFAGVEPCGMPGVRASSLDEQSGRSAPDVPSAAAVFAAALARRLGRSLEGPGVAAAAGRTACDEGRVPA